MNTHFTCEEGRVWRLLQENEVAQLWAADDSSLLAHGWAVCEPGMYGWTTTTYEYMARSWFNQMGV